MAKVNGVNEYSHEAMLSVVKDGLEQGKREDAIRQNLEDTFQIDDGQSGRVFAAAVGSVDSQLVKHLLIREIEQSPRATRDFFIQERKSLTEFLDRSPSLREIYNVLKKLD